MDTKRLAGKRVFWTSRWDKLWLLFVPIVMIVDIFYSQRYSSFWFWTILSGGTVWVIYILYHMFHPRFFWIDPKGNEGKLIQHKAFDLRYNDTGRFEYNDAGFHYTQDAGTMFVAWSDIETIFAFKRDLMTIDELNIAVFLKSNMQIQLTEETDGWFQFIVKIKEVFPNIDKDFDSKIVLPPFQTNLTLVYNSTDMSQSELISQYFDKYGR